MVELETFVVVVVSLVVWALGGFLIAIGSAYESAHKAENLGSVMPPRKIVECLWQAIVWPLAVMVAVVALPYLLVGTLVLWLNVRWRNR